MKSFIGNGPGWLYQNSFIGNGFPGNAGHPYALIWKGTPPDYTTYTRLGEGWSVGPDGSPVATPEDDTMYEYVDGVKKHLNYKGTNIAMEPLNFLNWDISSNNNVVGGQIDPWGGNGAYIVTAIANGFVADRIVTEENTEYTFSFFVKNNSGTVANYSVFDWSNLTDIIPTTSYFSQISDTDYTRITVKFTTTAGGISTGIYVDRDSGAGIALLVYGAQVNKRNYAIPFIPVHNQAVNQPALSIDTLKEPWKASTLDVPSQIVSYGLEGFYNGVGSGADLTDGLLAVNYIPEKTILSDAIDTSILNTHDGVSALISVGMRKTIAVPGTTYDVDFKSKANANQSGGFISIGDNSDLGSNPTNPNITTEYQDYKFRVSPTSTNFRFYANLGTLGDSFNILDLCVRATQPATGRTIHEGFNTRQVIAPNQLSDGYTLEAGWTEATPGELIYTGILDNDFYKFALRDDKYQKLTYRVTASTIDGDLVIANGAEATETVLDKTVGTHTLFFINDGTTSTNMGLGVRNNTAGSITVDTLSDKEVQTLTRPDEGPAYFYIDPDTGVLTAQDDAGNIAVFSSPLVDDTEYYKFWLSHNGPASQMWISVEETKGTSVKGVVQTFSGSFTAIGEFLKYTDSGVYHTVENVYWDDELAFAYVVKDGVPVVHEGKPEIYYT